MLTLVKEVLLSESPTHKKIKIKKTKKGKNKNQQKNKTNSNQLIGPT